MIIDLLRVLPAAILTTVLVTAVSLIAGGVLAVPLMLARISSSAPLRHTARWTIEVIRGVPPIVWLLIVFFGISIGAFRFNAFTAGVITLSLVAAAYLAEIYRLGYAAIRRGQFESAAALGLSRRDTLVQIVGPQAMRVALPAVTTYAIALLKDSSIVSTIGLTEIVYVTTAIARVSGDGITPFLIAAAIYVAISIPLALLSRNVDRRLRAKVAAS